MSATELAQLVKRARRLRICDGLPGRREEWVFHGVWTYRVGTAELLEVGPTPPRPRRPATPLA